MAYTSSSWQAQFSRNSGGSSSQSGGTQYQYTQSSSRLEAPTGYAYADDHHSEASTQDQVFEDWPQTEYEVVRWVEGR